MTRTKTYYNPDGRLQQAQLLGTGGSSASVAYTYQPDGLPATIATTGSLGMSTETFGYDNLGQLTSWQGDTGAPTVTYSYDNYGRLTSRSWSSETANYNAFGTNAGSAAWTVQVNGGTSEAYRHDAWGRVTNTPAVGLTYDPADKVVQLVETATGQIDTLKHDALGNRVLTILGSNGSAGSLLTLDDMFELKRTATVTEGRCRLRAEGAIVGDVVRTNGAARTAAFYLANTVGSVVAEASSASGSVVARSRRDPFGNLQTNPQTPYLAKDPVAANPDGTSRLGFGDHERDPNWGLVDMAARFYSPRLGRFTSPDPSVGNLSDRRYLNPFSYVLNSPTSYFDPLGYAAECGNCTPPSPQPTGGPGGPGGPGPGGDPGQGQCDNCGPDVKDPVGDDWRATKHGVAKAAHWTARVVVKGAGAVGDFFGYGGGDSGSFVNNTPVDPTKSYRGTSIDGKLHLTTVPKPTMNVSGGTMNMAVPNSMGVGMAPSVSSSATQGGNNPFPGNGGNTLAQEGFLRDLYDAVKSFSEVGARCSVGPCSDATNDILDLSQNHLSIGGETETTLSLPKFLGGGVGTFGLNLQLSLGGFTDSESGLFVYRPGPDVKGSGISAGSSFGFNLSLGKGPWAGAFDNYGGGFGPLSTSVFVSPGWRGTGQGWVGWTFGRSLGLSTPLGGSYTQTNYKQLTTVP